MKSLRKNAILATIWYYDIKNLLQDLVNQYFSRRHWISYILIGQLTFWHPVKERKLYLFALFAFSLFTFLLFWPIFFGKVNLNGHMLNSNFYPVFGRNLPFKNTGKDQLRIYFPTYHVTWEQVRQLTLPMWNPYSFSGQPHVGELQSSVFYPLNFFAFGA